MVLSIYTIQTIAFIICALSRYCTYKDVGTYSLQVRRPRIYRFKIALHMAIWLVLLTMFSLYIVPSDRDRYNEVRLYVTAT